MTASRNRFVSFLPWVLLGLTILGFIGVLYVSDLNGGGNRDGSVLEDFLLLAAFLAFPVVGSLIAWRQPRNAIGWMLLGIGLLVGFGVLGDEWARYAFFTRKESFPFATFGAWFSSWFWLPMIVTIPTILLLLFPTGRLPSRHWVWRATLAITIAMIGVVSLLAMLQEQIVMQLPDSTRRVVLDNPIGIAGLRNVEENIPFYIIFPSVFICAASLVVRFRRSKGDERQQLKWIVFAGITFATGVAIGDTVGLPDILFPIFLMMLPISIAVAVLKYRLYDISIVINKTLVYVLLTVILGAIYVGIVFLLQNAFRFGEDNQVAVAASTLAVAGLFGPVRRRLQDAIDHLFYRRKYDAARTVDTFSARLRDEVDLDTLTAELISVVDQTMRPTHASLWLRPAPED